LCRRNAYHPRGDRVNPRRLQDDPASFDRRCAPAQDAALFSMASPKEMPFSLPLILNWRTAPVEGRKAVVQRLFKPKIKSHAAL
jgi:hypothetical protein